MNKIAITTAAALALGAALPAFAQTFSAGVTITSNYMSRGVTQSDDGPALQFYGEVEASGFYAGIFGSNVDLGTDQLEIDLYGGYRFSLQALSLDIGYARYFYDDTGNCCGEVYLLASYDASPLTLSAGIYSDPESSWDVTDIHAGLDFAIASNWSAGLKVGRVPSSHNYGIASVGYQLNDNVGFALEYHATEAPGQSNRVVASVNVSF